MVNPLLNLSHFSAAKEAQFLSKEKKIPREEFHPYLQLIRSSEVDPFAPVPGASPSVIAALEKAKAGKADSETTYTLAVSNMMSQVELVRRDLVQVTSAMLTMQEKHKRDERNAFLLMLAAFGLLSVIMLKTRALEDLKDLVFGGAENEERKFDRKRLSHPPPSHGIHCRPSRPTPSEQSSSIRPYSSHIPLARKSVSDTKSTQTTQVNRPSPSPPKNQGWTLSSWFWAPGAYK